MHQHLCVAFYLKLLMLYGETGGLIAIVDQVCSRLSRKSTVVHAERSEQSPIH